MTIFLVSFATFLFEIILTRVAANTLWYHYAHIIIFLTMLGFGIGAHFSLRLETFPRFIKAIPALLSILFPLSLFVHLNTFHAWTLHALLFVLLQVILFSGCFFLSGVFISHRLASNPHTIHKTYFFDLIGSALGCLSAGVLLFFYWGTALVFLCSAACLCAMLWSWSGVKSRSVVLVFIFISLFLLHFNEKFNFLAIKYSKDITGQSFQILEQGKIFENWTPLSRVTVINQKIFGDKKMVILSDAGAGANLIKFDGNNSSLSQSDYCKSNLHYYQKYFTGETLIIGSGGGSYVLCALENGKQNITAVEINPGIVDIVKGEFASYIGNIFSKPQVQLHQEDGRNFIEKTTKYFDVIDISLTASWIGGVGGTYMFQEHNLYTKDAFKAYIKHLKPSGTLIVTRFVNWGESLRVANSIVEAAIEYGVQNIDKKILIIRNADRAQRATVFFKMDGFLESQIVDIESLYAGQDLKRLYPIKPFNTSIGSKSDMRFSQLIDRVKLGTTRNFVDLVHKEDGLDISTVTDDKPFFFFTEGFESLLHFKENRNHPARHLALLILLVISIGMPIVILIYGLSLNSKNRIEPRHGLYFGLAGAAFMFIEIPLLQIYSPIMGGQLYSMITVLAALMLFSGVGSLISSRFLSYPLQIKILPIFLLLSCGIIFATKIFQYQIISLSNFEKTLIMLTNLAPLGLAIGGFYPLGIRLFDIQKQNANYYWSLNCLCSAWAASCAMMISIYFGYSVTVLAGFLIYVFLSFRLIKSREVFGGSC